MIVSLYSFGTSKGNKKKNFYCKTLLLLILWRKLSCAAWMGWKWNFSRRLQRRWTLRSESKANMSLTNSCQKPILVNCLDTIEVGRKWVKVKVEFCFLIIYSSSANCRVQKVLVKDEKCSKVKGKRKFPLRLHYQWTINFHRKCGKKDLKENVEAVESTTSTNLIKNSYANNMLFIFDSKWARWAFLV